MLMCSHIYTRGRRKGELCGIKCKKIENKGLCHIHAKQSKYKKPIEITTDEFNQNLEIVVKALLHKQNLTNNNNKPFMCMENFGDVWEVVLKEEGDDIDVSLRYV